MPERRSAAQVTCRRLRRALRQVSFVAVSFVAVAWLLLGPPVPAQSAPTAPTRDQRALKVLAEARDLVASGRPDEAIPFYGHALDLTEAATDEPSVALAQLLIEYGDVLRGEGRRARARVSLERGLAMLGNLLPEDDPQFAVPLLGLGRLAADDERCADAVALLGRALALVDAEQHPARVVSARVALGRCAAGADADEAFDHVRAAVATADGASLAATPPPRPPPPEAPSPTLPTTARSKPAWRVQVSSHQSPAEAEREAESVRVAYLALLRAQPLMLQRVELASGSWHRVLFGAFDQRADAVALCDALKRAGLEDCLAKHSD